MTSQLASALRSRSRLLARQPFGGSAREPRPHVLDPNGLGDHIDQLYRAYLAILDRTERQVPFSNFVRVFGRLAAGPADDGFGRPPPLRVVGERRTEGPGRPARLYEFVGRPGDERREFYRW